MSLQPNPNYSTNHPNVMPLRAMARKASVEEAEQPEAVADVDALELPSKKGIEVVPTEESADKFSSDKKTKNAKELDSKASVEAKKPVKTDKTEKQAEDGEYHPPNPLKWVAIGAGTIAGVVATGGLLAGGAWLFTNHKPVITEETLKKWATNLEDVNFSVEAKKWANFKPDKKKYEGFFGGAMKWYDSVIYNGSMIPFKNKVDLILYHINPLGALVDSFTVKDGKNVKVEKILNLTDPIFGRKTKQRASSLVQGQNVALLFDKQAKDEGRPSILENPFTKRVSALSGTSDEQLEGAKLKMDEIGGVTDDNKAGLDYGKCSQVVSKVVSEALNPYLDKSGQTKIDASGIKLDDRAVLGSGTVGAVFDMPTTESCIKIMHTYLREEDFPLMIDKEIHKRLMENPKLTTEQAFREVLQLASSVYSETDVKLEHDTTAKVAKGIVEHNLSYQVPEVQGYFAEGDSKGFAMSKFKNFQSLKNIEALMDNETGYGGLAVAKALIKNYFRHLQETFIGVRHGDAHIGNVGMTDANTLAVLDCGRTVEVTPSVAKSIRKIVVDLTNPDFPIFVTPATRKEFEQDPVAYLNKAETSNALIKYHLQQDEKGSKYVITGKEFSTPMNNKHKGEETLDLNPLHQWLDFHANQIADDNAEFQSFIEDQVNSYNGKYYDKYHSLIDENPGLAQRLYVFDQLITKYEDTKGKNLTLQALKDSDNTLASINPEIFKRLKPEDKHALMYRISQNPAMVLEYLFKARLLEASMGTHINESTLKNSIEIDVANRLMAASGLATYARDPEIRTLIQEEINKTVKILVKDSDNFNALDNAAQQEEFERLQHHFKLVVQNQLNLPALYEASKKQSATLGEKVKPKYEGNFLQVKGKEFVADVTQDLKAMFEGLLDLNNTNPVPELDPNFLTRVKLNSPLDQTV